MDCAPGYSDSHGVVGVFGIDQSPPVQDTGGIAGAGETALWAADLRLTPSVVHGARPRDDEIDSLLPCRDARSTAYLVRLE